MGGAGAAVQGKAHPGRVRKGPLVNFSLIGNSVIVDEELQSFYTSFVIALETVIKELKKFLQDLWIIHTLLCLEKASSSDSSVKLFD